MAMASLCLMHRMPAALQVHHDATRMTVRPLVRRVQAACRQKCRHGLLRDPSACANAPRRAMATGLQIEVPWQSQGSDAIGSAEAEAAALRVTWLGLGSNIALSLGKGAVGMASGSAALVADAVHSSSDMVSDIMTLFAVKYSRRPADHNHPYGYGRFEPLGALGVSGLVTLAGAGIGHHSYEALRDLLLPSIEASVAEVALSNAPLALAACLASVAVKESLYHATIGIGRQVNSSVLVANAWHHRSDALSSVVAALGIVGHWLGASVLDPIAGGVVALMVTRMGLKMGWEAVKELMDAQLMDEEALHRIRSAALSSSPDVLDVHGLRCRVVGPTVFVDLHAVVPARLSVSAAHHTEQLLRQAVRAVEPRVVDVMVHLGPSSGADEEPMVDASDEDVQAAVRRIIKADFPQVSNITSLVCHFLPLGRLTVEVAVAAPSLDTLTDARQLLAQIRARLQERMARTCASCRCVDVISVDLRLDLLAEDC